MTEKMNLIRKTVSCIILAVICITCASGFADQHMEIQCRFSDTLGSKELLLDLYEQGTEITAVSTLFQDTAAVFSKDGSGLQISMDDMFRLFPERDIAEPYRKAEQEINSWLELQKYEVSKGRFSGELLQSAEIMESCSFGISDFSEYLNSTKEKEKTDNPFIYQLMKMLLQYYCSDKNENEPEPAIQVRKYEDGLYYTFILTEGEYTVLTFSVDRTTDKQRHIIAGYKSEGRYYYRDYLITFRENQIQIKYDLYGGTDSYRNMIKKSRPVFVETITVNRENEHKICWNATVESARLTDSLYAEGRLEAVMPGCYESESNLRLQNHPDLNIAITANIEPLGRPVHFTDKAEKHFSEKSEREEIETAAFSGIVQLAAEMIPMMPTDFQNLIIYFLLK